MFSGAGKLHIRDSIQLFVDNHCPKRYVNSNRIGDRGIQIDRQDEFPNMQEPAMSDTINHLELAYPERRERKSGLMADLFRQLDNWGRNRKILGPSACEHAVLR